MKYAKCFGGGFDGQLVAIDPDIENGDHWRLPVRPKISVMEGQPIEVQTMEVEYEEEYVVESIRTKKIEIRFLRYTGKTIEEIFTEIFT